MPGNFRHMRSIIDYIKKYGRFTVSEMPVNEVDSLILCQFSYLKYDGIIPGIKDRFPSMTLSEIAMSDDFDKLFEDKRYEKNNRKLFSIAAGSARFGSMHLGNYVSMTDESWELQFSAMTFTFENGTFYLAYRGTDETFVGWKEDCNMALITPVPAQEKAMQYLNLIADMSHGNFYIGGHSKGGNLAIYAASTCLNSVSDRILAIYNHDGPGFKKGTVTETEGYKIISDRIKKFIPHSSIVGMLMSSEDEAEIIECRSFGVFQHNPFNWVVDKKTFKKADGLYRHVSIRDESVNRWIDEMSDEDRRIFVDELFKVLYSNGATTLLDIMDDFRSNSIAMKKAFDEIDPKNREVIKRIFSNLQNTLQEVKYTRSRIKSGPRLPKIFARRKEYDI